MTATFIGTLNIERLMETLARLKAGCEVTVTIKEAEHDTERANHASGLCEP